MTEVLEREYLRLQLHIGSAVDDNTQTSLEKRLGDRIPNDSIPGNPSVFDSGTRGLLIDFDGIHADVAITELEETIDEIMRGCGINRYSMTVHEILRRRLAHKKVAPSRMWL